MNKSPVGPSIAGNNSNSFTFLKILRLLKKLIKSIFIELNLDVLYDSKSNNVFNLLVKK